ncbi:MAG: DUF4302 domain-containing protein [Prevotella sp.]|nr:DUF4302 domain-containing protein [Prevotella sp.]
MKRSIAKGLICCGMVAVLSTVFTSCRFEDEDYFSESAALRIEHQGEELRNQLVSAPNGWVMQFFCASDIAQFEGFNLFARFEDNGKVTMASDHRLLRNGKANSFTEASSPYEILNEDGLVLAFNVWNDVLTPFSDPVAYWAAPNNILKDGEGMHGDYNFVIMSRNENEVIMRGERYQAQVRLVKCDRPWKQYNDDVKAMKAKITNTTINDYYVTNGSRTLYFQGVRNGKFLYTDNLDKTKAVKVDSVACVFTPNGLRLERRDSIGGNKFQELVLAADQSCLQSEDGSVRVMACWDTYVLNFPSLKKLDKTSLTPEQQTLYDEIEAEVVKANSTYTLSNISIGTSAGDVTGLVITYTYRSNGKRVTANAAIELNVEKLAYGQVSLGYSDANKADENMIGFNSKSANEVEKKVRQLAATLAGTYQMIPDSYFLPSAITFNSMRGGTTFKVD